MHIFCKHDYSSKFIYFRLRNFSISIRLLSFQVIESQTWTWTHRPPKSSIEPAPPPSRIPRGRDPFTSLKKTDPQVGSLPFRTCTLHCHLLPSPPPSRPALDLASPLPSRPPPLRRARGRAAARPGPLLVPAPRAAATGLAASPTSQW